VSGPLPVARAPELPAHAPRRTCRWHQRSSGRARPPPRLQRHEGVSRRPLPAPRARPGGTGRDLDRRRPPATSLAAAIAEPHERDPGLRPGPSAGVRRRCTERSVRAVERGRAARTRARVGLDFEPGRGWAYSNTGYLLVRRIVDRSAPGGFAGALERELLGPPGMTNTSLALELSDLDGLVPGWSTEIGEGRRDVRGRYHPRWVGHRTLASTSAAERRPAPLLDRARGGRAVRPRAADRIRRDRLRRPRLCSAEQRAR
jgi:hypothetical protein